MTRMSSYWFRRYLMSASLTALVVSGCSGLKGPVSTGNRATVSTQVTKEDLHDRLDQFEDWFEAVIRRASDELVEVDNSRRVKRLTLVWQMRILPMARNAITQENPLGGYLDAWSLCIRMRLFLTEGEGKKLFGEHQDIAVAAARECEAEIEKIGATVMTPETLAAARERVQAVAEERPLRGDFSGTEVRASLQTGEKDQVLQGVLAIPMTPFRWLGGVDAGAQAIKGFTVVAARLTDVVEGFASDARLQTQLLLLETEDLETVKSTVASLERVSKSSERLATSAEKLTGAVEGADSKNAEIRETVHQTHELVKALEPAGQSVATAGDAWARTAKAIQEMVASFRQPATGEPATSADPSTGPQRPPYDVNDYRRAAEALTQTAKEMQTLITDLREFSESGPAAQRLEEITRRFQGVLSDSTDRAMWRAVQVALIVLILAVVYRLVAVRFIRPRGT